jgi:hypothetical protein
MHKNVETKNTSVITKTSQAPLFPAEGTGSKVQLGFQNFGSSFSVPLIFSTVSLLETRLTYTVPAAPIGMIPSGSL